MRLDTEADLEEIWASASPEALEQTVKLACNLLRAPAAFLSSAGPAGDIVRAIIDPEHIVARSRDDGTVEPPVAALAVPIRLASGRDIGSLRVVDAQPLDWPHEAADLLTGLAASLTREIDLTLQMRQKEKAAASAAALFEAIDRIPALVFERRKIAAGRSSYTFFGASKTQLPAVRKMMEGGGVAGDLAFLHRDDRELVRTAILRSNLEETDLDLTFRVKDVDGSIRWLRSQSIVRRDPDGGVAWNGFVIDVSDLVALRDEAEAIRADRDASPDGSGCELDAPIQAIRAGAAEAAGGPVMEGEAGRSRSHAAADARPAPGAGRILLADDLDLNRKLVADMLSLEGHVVDCVADGEQAVRAARDGGYDLILMDLMMPEMDGIAATQAIRMLPAPACRVPIVALTANSSYDQLDDAIKAGMDATLSKPMSLDALNAAVSEWVRGRHKAA